MWTSKIFNKPKTENMDEVKRFNSLPKKVQFQSIEYYALVKKYHKGINLTRADIDKFWALSSVVDKHGITSLSFEGEVM